MTVPVVRVGDIAEQIRGVTFAKSESVTEPAAGYVPVLRAGNIQEAGLDFTDLVYVPAARVRDKQKVRKNDVVIAASSGSLEVVGKAARSFSNFEGGFGAFCKVLRPNSKVDAAYFSHFFKTPGYRRKISALAEGANINNLKNEHLDDLLIPLPPLEEQRRIAAILDQADAIRAERRQVLVHLDSLTQSIFHDMFGDPATNPRGQPLATVGSLAAKFSDGPFGSNLKSNHYTSAGVPVIRLQNIGVGRYLDGDRAFVSPEHYATLAKHDCKPGDVLIGTLGDPNLRACIQPDSMPIALNKADCIQMRVDPSKAVPEFAAALLNMPGTLSRANALVHGQTRSRISMGRLRDLPVPVPGLEEQRQFARRVQHLAGVRKAVEVAAGLDGDLFSSLQSRAFQGEL